MEIRLDEYPVNPREGDNFSVIVVLNPRYGGGDLNLSKNRWEDFYRENEAYLKEMDEKGLLHKIMAYIHSGVSVRLDTYGNWPDQQWDCVMYGLIYPDINKIKEEFDWKRLSKKRLEQIDEIVRIEFAEWKNWIEGDTYYIYDEKSDEPIFWGSYDECEAEMESLQPVSNQQL